MGLSRVCGFADEDVQNHEKNSFTFIFVFPRCSKCYINTV